VFKGNLFYNGGHTDGNTASGTAEGDSITATALSTSGNNNSFREDPKLAVTGTPGGTGINAWSAHPTSGSPALSGASTLADTSFLTQTSYRGAFDGITDWTTWTKTTTGQYLATLTSDYDGDSLTLAQEISSSYNTNPISSDTDGDGINDDQDTVYTNDNSARLINISTRGYVGTGANQELVGGFVLKGTPGGTKTILVKGVAQYMVGADGLTTSDLLDNPKLKLQDAFGKVVALNDDWKTMEDLSSVATENQSIFATSYSTTTLQESDYDAYRNELNSHDGAAAMLITVPLLTEQQASDLFGNAAYAGYNLFTAIVSSSSGASGIAQVVIEDLDRSGDYASTAKLVNISTRGYVGSGSNQKLVGGFVILGDAGKSKKLLAKGSAQYMLGADGLSSSDLLANPQLKLQDIVGNAVSRNDNWNATGSLESSDTVSVFSSTYDVSGLSGSTYDIYRNELDGYTNASAMMINLPMMTSDQAQSLAGNSAYAGYALYTAIVSGSASSTGVAQVTVEDLDRE